MIEFLKQHLVYLAGLGWLVMLGLEESPPGCVSIRDHEGNAVLWACRFGGRALGIGLFLLFWALPWLVMPLFRVQSGYRIVAIAKIILVLIAWRYFVRYDLRESELGAVRYMFVRGWPFYMGTLVLSAILAVLLPRCWNVLSAAKAESL